MNIFLKLHIFKILKKLQSGGPVFVKVPNQIEPLSKDASITFEYVIEGIPKPTINWYKKNKYY